MSLKVAAFLALCPLIHAQTAESVAEPVRQMAFVSCLKQTHPAPAMDAIAALKPDVFIWMGDNIYGDSEDMAVLARKYQEVRELPAYALIRSRARVTGTWDDHDYGANDAGKEFPMRAESQQVFLDFLDVPESSPRRKREGVYSVSDFGPPGKMVRVISLDTRYFRDEIGSNGTMLGEVQWKWLEKMLSGSSAEVNVIVSSIQVLPAEHRFEKWENFPKERQRLLDLLAKPEMPPVLLLSGDRHMSEISLDEESCGYPLYEITSSSLNLPIGSGEEPNRSRVGSLYRPSNFGTLSIDWGDRWGNEKNAKPRPILTACIRDEEGRPQRAVSFELKR
ncbi:alkaline phosphatase D family protein [Haloferula rosea]|uniref:Alkaline phosphatase family protein n=1 Tax=Haloferula rosea TaxID=490093 RepID=A0A934RF21_9BACT|nr:alkaline phosphatase D family protein [Haloferula rosea]MBK1828342.1 alkaline phosphatase family protein [Haloferula rosea]